MKTYLGILFFGIILLSGCDQSDSKKTNSTTEQTVTQEEQAKQDINSEGNSDNVSITPPPAKTALGMNPAHGQPGHDCAIPVGAPLNSKNNSSPVINPGSSSPVKSVQGMNPAHGQPGHDCAIPVGAPLNK